MHEAFVCYTHSIAYSNSLSMPNLLLNCARLVLYATYLGYYTPHVSLRRLSSHYCGSMCHCCIYPSSPTVQFKQPEQGRNNRGQEGVNRACIEAGIAGGKKGFKGLVLRHSISHCSSRLRKEQLCTTITFPCPVTICPCCCCIPFFVCNLRTRAGQHGGGRDKGCEAGAHYFCCLCPLCTFSQCMCSLL